MEDMKTLILHEEKFLNINYPITTLVTWGAITANLILSGLLYKRYQILKALTATLTLIKYSDPDMALSVEIVLTEESPARAEVICYDPPLSQGY